MSDIENELRREAILILGHSPNHQGDLEIHKDYTTPQRISVEATIGRAVLRKLNMRARKRASHEPS